MSDANQKSDDITVEIEKVQNATVINKGTNFFNFFEEELKQAIVYINYILDHIKNQNDTNTDKNRDEEDNYFHQHNTIAVLGPRGGGKTSFMLTLRDKVLHDTKENKELKENKKLKEKIVWLPNLDPTRMEENETFLVTVVANILKEIKKRSKGDLEDNVREALESISRDFVVLASEQIHEEQWKDLIGDPDSFAYEVLTNAHSGLNLARSFHEFLGVCLKKVLHADAFIQPIDDVDTAIKQGWPILETLRKYLATPHLITILSGDIDLYETLVRKQQLDKLSYLLENESRIGENVGKIGKQVGQLTEQYLAKVMPSHLRIRLKPIAEYIMQKAAEGKDLVKLQFDEKTEYLSKIYAGFTKDLFGFDWQGEEPIQALNPRNPRWGGTRLLPSITRDLVRFFKALKPWYDKKVDAEKIEETLEALVQIFNAALYSGNITPNDLMLLKQGRHLEWLGDYCLNARQDAQEFWRLFPRYDDEDWNHRALLLNAFLFQSWKANLYPHRPMSYGIKVLLPCLLADSRDLTGEKLLEMKRFFNIGNTERHFWMAIRGLAYRLRDSADEWSRYGSGYVKVELPPPESKFSINWKNPLGWFCYFMYRPNNGKALYADILIAIARLVDVLREGRDYKENELGNLFDLFIQDRVWYLHSQPPTKSASSYSFRASGKLIGLFPIGDVSIAKVIVGEVEPINSSILDHKFPIKVTDEFRVDDGFKQSMYTWIQKMKELKSEKILPPPIIARMWKRFIDNLEYIRSDIEITESNDVTLTGILSCWIKAFLNASLIEEVILRRGVTKSNIFIENIRFSLSTNDDAFKRNLETLKDLTLKDLEIIYYTRAWMCCPLFLFFIEPESLYENLSHNWACW